MCLKGSKVGTNAGFYGCMVTRLFGVCMFCAHRLSENHHILRCILASLMESGSVRSSKTLKN